MFDGWTYEEIAEKHSEEYAARKRDKLRYRHGTIHIHLVLNSSEIEAGLIQIAIAQGPCPEQQNSFGMLAACCNYGVSFSQDMQGAFKCERPPGSLHAGIPVERATWM